MRYLRLVWGGTDRYVIEGETDGRRYEFGVGEPTPVLESDVPQLLGITVRQTVCCGGGNPPQTVSVLEEVLDPNPPNR